MRVCLLRSYQCENTRGRPAADRGTLQKIQRIPNLVGFDFQKLSPHPEYRTKAEAHYSVHKQRHQTGTFAQTAK